MISSIHRTFASDRGSTRWWAALASAALILASASLPAVAADGDGPPAEEAAISQPAEVNVIEAEVTAPETEATEQEPPPAVEAAEPAAPEPDAEEAAAEPVVAEEPAVEEPAVEELAVEEPGVEEPGVEEPGVEQQARQEKATDLPVAEESAALVAPSGPTPVEVASGAEPAFGEAPEQIVPAPEEATTVETAPALRSRTPEPDPIVVQGPSAAGVTPVPMDLNPSAACIDLGYDYGFKVEAGDLDYDGPLNGVPESRLTVDLSTATLGEVIAWTSTAPIGAVLVKGGELSNVYTYVPSAYADSLLHSPTNANNGKYPQVSNVSFCWNDQGYLELEKVFDPLASGFAGTFAVNYTCGAYPKATIELAAGATKVVGPFDAGTVCTVTEPVLPTAPTGWTFGTPVITGSPATIVKGDQAAAVTVTVTNTITKDQGYLRLSKVFAPGTSGFAGTFAVAYTCGTDPTVTVNLAAGASTVVGPFDVGTSCTVSEPSLPTAPTGWTFGTPQFTGNPATIVKGDQAAAVTVTVTNTITKDQGYLRLSKVFAPGASGFTGTFTVAYTCGGTPQATVELAAGATKAVGPFDPGTVCTVSEPTLPTAPPGWTFGTAQVAGSPATIVKGDQAAAVTVTVTNTITKDQGYLRLSKVFAPGASGFAGPFTVAYTCGTNPTATVNLAAGASTVVGPFDTGTVCTVGEPVLPAAPTGWTFGTPQFTGNPATIVKGDQAAAVTVTVTNTITASALGGTEDEAESEVAGEESVVAAEEALASTGVNNVGTMLTSALLALLTGVLLVAASRRRVAARR